MTPYRLRKSSASPPMPEERAFSDEYSSHQRIDKNGHQRPDARRPQAGRANHHAAGQGPRPPTARRRSLGDLCRSHGGGERCEEIAY